MPGFREIFKSCKHCGSKLILKNQRDTQRKNFCSHSCRAKFYITPEKTAIALSKSSTPEANAKKGFKKEKHPKWIQDRSKLKDKRNLSEMKEWRKSIFERDNYTCVDCGKKGDRLNAHHKIPVVRIPMYKFELWNGITLCEPCHKEIHRAADELFNSGGYFNKLKESQIAF